MNLAAVRHFLHQYPELSGKEFKTSAFIATQLRKLEVQLVHDQIADTGVLGIIHGKEKGKTVLFRSELDALPIEEKTLEIPYKSLQKGVSHKCGHDGHMTILLGLAEKLAREGLNRGSVLFLFQPAEETGKGAKAVIESGVLKQYPIDYVFALHNVPGYPLGSLVGKQGSFTPAVESLDIHLIGKTSHAGMPEMAVSPAAAVAEIIQFFQRIQQPDKTKEGFFSAAPIRIKMGEKAYGTAAGSAVVGYTIRAFDPQIFQQQKQQIELAVAEVVAKTPGLKFQIQWKEAFQANINHLKAQEFIEKAATQNNFPFIEMETGFTWGEDFGFFTQHYTGAMFGLGAGKKHPELHHPDYDFPDELIAIGTTLFYSLTKLITK